MNLDRTIGVFFLKWPARDVKRPALMVLLFLGGLIFVMWSFSGTVKVQSGEFLRRLIKVPAAEGIHSPPLSDPVIDRLAAGAQVSADGGVIVTAEQESYCSQPCYSRVVITDVATGKQEIASLGLYGVAADAEAVHPSLSQDGRFVAYSSPASNLVKGDTNAASDIFLYDRHTHQIRRISQAAGGGQADGDSYTPALSADGRSVAFISYAENLVAGDTNKRGDVFLVDLEKGSTRRLSVDPSGSQADRDAHHPAISADGKIVVFSSAADNIVAGDTNAVEDVFAVDIETGKIIRLSMAVNGSQSDGDSFDATLSADGRFLAFASYATNLSAEKNAAVNVFLYDSLTRQTHCVSCDPARRDGGQAAWKPRFAPDGRLLLFDMLIPADEAQSQSRWQAYGYDCEHGQIYRLAAGDGTEAPQG